MTVGLAYGSMPETAPKDWQRWMQAGNGSFTIKRKGAAQSPEPLPTQSRRKPEKEGY
jgi:hypothetical protein